MPFETVATIQCSVVVTSDDLLLSPQLPVVASPQIDLVQDLISFPPSAITVIGAASAVGLSCSATNEGGGFTLTGTVLATRVTTATVT